MTRARATVLAVTAAMALAVAGGATRPAFADGLTRVKGKVVDNHGKPMENVAIYFDAADVKKRVGPLKTNRKGEYVIASLDKTVAQKWRVVPDLKGYKVVKVHYEIVDSEKKERANTDQLIGSKQELPDLPFALVGDEGRNVVDFVVANDAEYNAAFDVERRAKEGGSAAAAAPGAPGAAPAATATAGGPAPAQAPASTAPPGGREMLQQAKALADAGNHAQAIELYKNYLTKDPTGNPATYYYLGKSLFETGDDGGAEQALHKALELNKDMKGAHFYLGNIALKEENADQAVAEYEQELKLSADTWALLYNLGQAYSKAGKDDQALAVLDKAATIDPSKPDAMMLMASIYEKRKDTAKAQEMYEKVRAIDPRNAAILFYNVGVKAWNENRAQDAAQAFKKSIEIDPNYPQSHRELARALMGVQDFQGALGQFQEYLKLNPNAPDSKEIKDNIALLKK